MNSRKAEALCLALVDREQDDFAPVCPAELFRPNIPPGEYVIRCIARKRPYRSKLLNNSWKLCLIFGFMDGRDDTVVMFFHLGDGEKPELKKRSKYIPAWELAAGRKAGRTDRLTARVFDGKIFKARIDYTKKTYDGGRQNSVSRYSVVKELLEVGP